MSTTLTWQAAIDAAIEAREADMIALRRHLHAHPEASGEEYETSLHLYQQLEGQGFAVRMGPDGRGVLADQDLTGANGKPGVPRIALRADIDALRIHDEKRVPYRSQRDGIMHACGHDVHTAIVFGALASLSDLSEHDRLPWPINLRGIFQPSEETATGAAEMVDAGAIDGTDAILSMHVDPTRRAGTIGIKTGVLTAHCDDMRLLLIGRGGHAARPHETADPIAAAAQLINAIYLFVPRTVDSQDAVVVTIGQITAGQNANVIPERVELNGTLRTLRLSVRERTVKQIEQLCRGVAEACGVQIEVQFNTSIGSVINDAALVGLLGRAAEDVLGTENVEKIPRPSMGSEDFSVYLEHVPGAMFRLGATSPGGERTSLHTPNFDVDERAIPAGAKILARAVVEWSNPASREPIVPQI